jgi:nucleoside-triphosphatase
MKVFVTGMPGSGKSTLVMSVAKKLGVKYAGLVTPDIRKDGRRTGFKMVDLRTGEEIVMASVDFKGKSIGRYGVNIEGINEMVRNLEKEIENPWMKVVVIDEIGPMEMLADVFEDVVKKVMKSEKDVLAVIHRKYADKFRKFGKVFVLSEWNRKEIEREILEEFKK